MNLKEMEELAKATGLNDTAQGMIALQRFEAFPDAVVKQRGLTEIVKEARYLSEPHIEVSYTEKLRRIEEWKMAADTLLISIGEGGRT